MRNLLHAGLVALLLTPAATDVRAQTAGAKKLGVAVERNDIIKGWSARHQILSQSVNNDKDEKIGKVEDIIFIPERSAFVRDCQHGRLSRHGFARRRCPGRAIQTVVSPRLDVQKITDVTDEDNMAGKDAKAGGWLRLTPAQT
jgi:hypothetical protein